MKVKSDTKLAIFDTFKTKVTNLPEKQIDKEQSSPYLEVMQILQKEREQGFLKE